MLKSEDNAVFSPWLDRDKIVRSLEVVQLMLFCFAYVYFVSC